jgi:hypothetical protein
VADLEEFVADAESAGLIRRRLRGGYKVTLRGSHYARDACLRHEDLRAHMSKQADEWASGTMTKAERREALVELVLLAWNKDQIAEADALADLRSQGFDPLAPETRAEMRDKFGFEPFIEEEER